MGRQIEVAQSHADEAALCSALRKRYAFYAIPCRQASPAFVPRPLGSCEAQEQFIFLDLDSDNVLLSIEQKESSSTYFVNRTRVLGKVIEWDRTRWIDSSQARAGRFYFDTGRPLKVLEQAMTAIQRYVRANYPLKSNERSPIYVGPDMSQMIQQGKVRIVYANGSTVELVANE